MSTPVSTREDPGRAHPTKIPVAQIPVEIPVAHPTRERENNGDPADLEARAQELATSLRAKFT